jgi:hypothetical protein
MSLSILLLFTPLVEGPGRIGDLKIGTGGEVGNSTLSTEGFTGLLDHPGIVVAGELKDRSKMGGGGGNMVGDKGTDC